MASQEDFDQLKAEVELLKTRLAASEETIRQQSEQIATLSATVARIDAATATKVNRASMPLHSAAMPAKSKKHPQQQATPLAEQQVAGSHPPQPVRRSSVTMNGKGASSRVTKSATYGHLAAPPPAQNGSNGATKPAQRGKQSSARPSKYRNPLIKTKEASFDRDSHFMRLYLRGRSVTLPGPSTGEKTFDITKPTEAPTETLKLEWAHGFRGKQILLLPTGEIVYACAALVVLMQPTGERSQRFYTEHTDDVRSLALHPDRVTMASGQVAGHDKETGRPHVRIWNSVTLQTIRILGLEGGFDRAVSGLSFSKVDSGALLAAVDDSNEHVMSLFNWASGSKLGDIRVANETVLGVEFNPTNVAPMEIATWGRFGLIWWSITLPEATAAANKTPSFKIARMKQATFDAKDRPRVVTCATYSNDGSLLIAGDSNGGLSWWPRGSTRVGRLLPGAHANGAVSAIFVSPDAEWLLSAGAKDRTIVKWSIRNEPPDVISKLQIPFSTTVRALQLSGNGTTAYIGTSHGSIVTASGIEETESLAPLIQGHSEEVWGVAVHPTKPSISVSVGYDRLLIVWDVAGRRSLAVRELPSAGHSISFHPQGLFVAIGLRSGEWLAVDLSAELDESSPSVAHEPVKVIHSDHPAHEQIECLAFSPDGSYLAVGSRDQQIYVYSVSIEGGAAPTFARISRCSGHSSYLTHLDWTTDSKYLRSNSGDYELLFWEAVTGRQILFTSSAKDQEQQLNSSEAILEQLREPTSWASQSCTLAFTSAGIWPNGADGTDINCADKAHAKPLLAIGDDFGKVRLFRWPCSGPRSLSYAACGHSSHVTSAMFTSDDARLLSAGGRDCSIFQWTLTNSQ